MLPSIEGMALGTLRVYLCPHSGIPEQEEKARKTKMEEKVGCSGKSLCPLFPFFKEAFTVCEFCLH